jgi:hypothetical protein
MEIFCVLGLIDIVEGSVWIPAENCVSIVFFNFSPILLDLPAKDVSHGKQVYGKRPPPGAFASIKDEFCSTQEEPIRLQARFFPLVHRTLLFRNGPVRRCKIGMINPERSRDANTKQFRIIQIFTLLGMFIGLMAQSGEAATWAVYQDDTQKCRLDYANSIFTSGEIDDENFQRFAGPNSDTYFRVAGLYNEEQLSPREIRAEYIKDRGKSDLVYERTKRDFLVLSGIRDQKIFYTKIALSPNNKNICVLHIVYPRKAKRAFDPIVTRMSRSFKAVN